MEKVKNYRTIKLIKFYQRHKRISGRCHFVPSCSNYAIEAYQKFNWFYASLLTGFRILRCHPFTRRRVDLVPLTKEEKKVQKILASFKKNYDSFYIDMVLKHSHLYQMENIDYVILTIEYLYGINMFIGASSYNKLEYLGKNYVRCNFVNNNNQPLINKQEVDQYLDILTMLDNYGLINFTNQFWDFDSLYHSKTYIDNHPIDYFVCPSKNLPINFWKIQIETFFTEQTIIGFENATEEMLSYFKNEWKAIVIKSENLTHKLVHSLKNKIIIIIGNNLTNPKISYFLNCIVRFYNSDDIFDLNKYNILIPK